MEEPLWKNFNLTDYPETGDKITATVSMATLTDQYLVQVGGLKRHIAERLFPFDQKEEALTLFEKIATGASFLDLAGFGVVPNRDKKNLWHRIEKRVTTPDNWCPTAQDGTVCVSFLGLRGPAWRVCVWGEDDLGMEWDFLDDQFEKAQAIYDSIYDGVTIQQLKQMGFDYA
jgi:hypothetical protein